jgi:hypothetical protein
MPEISLNERYLRLINDSIYTYWLPEKKVASNDKLSTVVAFLPLRWLYCQPRLFAAEPLQ